MPAPEADRAALEDEIGFEADNAAMTQVDPHALWQPIVHPAAAHCNLPSSKVNMIVSFVARRFVASGVEWIRSCSCVVVAWWFVAGSCVVVAGLFRAGSRVVVLVRAYSWRVRACSCLCMAGSCVVVLVCAWSCLFVLVRACSCLFMVGSCVVVLVRVCSWRVRAWLCLFMAGSHPQVPSSRKLPWPSAAEAAAMGGVAAAVSPPPARLVSSTPSLY